MKDFALGLLYPAILGSMIMMLFLRFAEHGASMISEPETLFGLLVAAFYSLGFIHSNSSTPYTGWLCVVDCFSSLMIFVCYDALGLNDLDATTPANFQWLYWPLLPVVSTPVLRRFAAGNYRAFGDRKDWFSVASIGVLAAGIAGYFGPFGVFWALLAVLLSYAVIQHAQKEA